MTNFEYMKETVLNIVSSLDKEELKELVNSTGISETGSTVVFSCSTCEKVYGKCNVVFDGDDCMKRYLDWCSEEYTSNQQKGEKMDEIGERIYRLRKGLNFTQTEFANMFGVTHAHISSIEKGKYTPSKTLIMFISEKLGVSENWLQTGKGDMQPKEGYLKILEKSNGKVAFEVNGTHAEMVRFVSEAIIFIAEQISEEAGIPYDVVEKDVVNKVIQLL